MTLSLGALRLSMNAWSRLVFVPFQRCRQSPAAKWLVHLDCADKMLPTSCSQGDIVCSGLHPQCGASCPRALIRYYAVFEVPGESTPRAVNLTGAVTIGLLHFEDPPPPNITPVIIHNQKSFTCFLPPCMFLGWGPVWVGSILFSGNNLILFGHGLVSDR